MSDTVCTPTNVLGLNPCPTSVLYHSVCPSSYFVFISLVLAFVKYFQFLCFMYSIVDSTNLNFVIFFNLKKLEIKFHIFAFIFKHVFLLLIQGVFCFYFSVDIFQFVKFHISVLRSNFIISF